MASLASATPVPPATVNLGGLLPSLAGLDGTAAGGNAPLIVVIHVAQTATPQVVHIHLHPSAAPTAAPSVPCSSTQQISTPAPHVQHVSPATFVPQPRSPHVAVAPISATRQFSSPRVAPPTARSPLGRVSPTAASANGNAQWQPHVVRASPPLQPTRSSTSPRPAWRRVPTAQQQQAAAVAAASQVISAASPDRERDILDVLAELQQLEAVLNPPLNSASSSSALAMMTQVPTQGTGGGWRRQPTLSQQQQQQLQQSRPSSSFYGAIQLSQGPFGPESTIGGPPETVTDTLGEDMIFPLDPADDPALQPSASASAGAGVTPSIVDGHLPESVPISHLPSRTGSAYQTAAEDSPRLMHTTNMTALVPAVDASVPRQPTPDFPVNFPDGTDDGGGTTGRRSVQPPARPTGHHGGQQQLVDEAFLEHHHAQMVHDELLAHERVHEHRHVEDQPDSSWSMWVPGMQLPVSAPVPLNMQRPGFELWSPPAASLASPPGLPASLYAGSPPIPNPHLQHQLVHVHHQHQQQRPNAKTTAASFGFGEASPRVRHASPRMEFSSPPQRFVSPPQHYTSSPQHYADAIQEDEYSTPPRQFASPPQQFASPPQLFTSPPRSSHGPPQSQSQLFTSPPQYYRETATPSPTQTQFASPQTHMMMEFSSPMQFASPLGPGHPDRALELDASVSTLVRSSRSTAADEQPKLPTVPQDPFARLRQLSPPVTSPIIRTSSRRLGATGRPLSMSDVPGSFASLAGLAAAKSPMMTSSVQALPQQHSGGVARHPSQAWLSSHALYQQAQSMESSASLTESMLQFHQQMQEQAHAQHVQEQAHAQQQHQQQQQQEQAQGQEQQEKYYQQSPPQSPSPPPHVDQSAGMPSPPFNAGNLPEPVQQDSDHDSDDHDPRQGHRHGLGHDQLGLIQEHDTLMGMPSSPDTLRFRSSNEVAGHAAQQQQQQQQPKRRQMTVRIAEGHQHPNRLAAARAAPRSPDYVWPTMARQATSPTAPGPGPAAMARAVTIAAPYSPPLSPAMPYSPPLSPPPQPPTQHTYPPRSTTNSGSGSGSKSSTSNSTSPAGPGVGRASSSSTMSMGVSSVSSYHSSSPTRTMYHPPSVIVPPSPNVPLLMDFAVRSPVMTGAMSPLAGGGSPTRPAPVHRNSGGRQRPGISQQTQSQRSSATSQGHQRRPSGAPQGAPRPGSGEWTWVV